MALIMRSWIICHVRVAFATNDERTAKRVSDVLGTATEMRAMKNYAGHRLSPWLGHLMVSRQETARPLLTPGEVMQLPSADELVLVSGIHSPTRPAIMKIGGSRSASCRRHRWLAWCRRRIQCAGASPDTDAPRAASSICLRRLNGRMSVQTSLI
jgi:hypothetical protein